MRFTSASVRWLGAALLASATQGAWAELDTYEVWHKSGNCGDWSTLSQHDAWPPPRLDIATGEKLHVRLWGHGADLAVDAKASGIHEWIADRGRSTDYPNAPIYGGQRLPKGYVTVAIEAKPEHGTGSRNVVVSWPFPGQPETIPVRIVATCQELTKAGLRYPPGFPTISSGTVSPIAPPPTFTNNPPAPFVDLLPRATLDNIFRRVGNSGPVTVNGISYLRVDDRWCSGFPIPTSGSASRSIVVPHPVWGITNAGTAANGAAFTSRLRTGTGVLQTTTTAAGGLGAGATTGIVFTRPNSAARVIRFAIPQPQGCFVNPADSGFWEDPPLIVEVDTGGAVAESNEDNNSFTF